MYGLALRTVLAASQGPVAGQTYRAEELNKESAGSEFPQALVDPRREREAREAAEEPLDSKEKRADDFKLRLKLRKAAIAAEKDKRKAQEEAESDARTIAEVEARFAAEDALAAAAPRPVKEKPPDPYANMDLDFDFEGDGTPFRFARGKASRVTGGKEGVRLARAQLRGEETMKLVLKDGTLKHTGPVTPFGGLGISGLLSQQDVRTEFRDYIVGWVQEALGGGTPCWGAEGGLRIAIMGSQILLFNLELVERIRALGVHVVQICLIDPEWMELNASLRQGLREFADWQRATAQVSNQAPAEVLAFASLEDYYEVCEDGRRGSGCHLFVHCQAAWGESIVLDRRRQMIRGMVPGALLVRLINDYSTKQANASLAEPTTAEGWFSMGAWTIAPGKPPSITPIRKTQYAGILGAIVNVTAATVQQARASAEARQKAQKEREKAALQRKMQEEQSRGQDEAARRVAQQGQAGGQATAAEEEPERMEDGGRTSIWRVIFKPHIAVRNAPRRTAMIVGAVYPGEEITAINSRRVDNWLCIGKAPKRPPGAEIPPESFVMADSGDGQTVFLEEI